ncbi:MAG TPA: hypothetical protein VFG21_06265 [Xanthomonadaceae bacterium]|nr:hypothetical protein [Xanthomonadaceae bacterium]
MRRLLACAACALLAQAPGATPPTGGDFRIVRSSIDGGGGRSDGGAWVLDGSIGQHDAAVALTGGAFVLHPGLWTPASIDPGDAIFADGFESVSILSR